MSTISHMFDSKLALMRSAAPRAGLRIFVAADAWCLYGTEAQEAHRLCRGLVRLQEISGGDDIMDESAWCAEVPLVNLPQFFEMIRQHHSIAVVDVEAGRKGCVAQHRMVLFLPAVGGGVPVKKSEPEEGDWA